MRAVLAYNQLLNGNTTALPPYLGGLVGFCLPAAAAPLLLNIFNLCALEDGGGFARAQPDAVSFAELLIRRYKVMAAPGRHGVGGVLEKGSFFHRQLRRRLVCQLCSRAAAWEGGGADRLCRAVLACKAACATPQTPACTPHAPAPVPALPC